MLFRSDMLYLPPRYAHDGIAEACVGPDGKAADCMTYSIGFRSPALTELAAELLHRLAEFGEASAEAFPGEEGNRPLRQRRIYRDPGQPATATPAALPDALRAFAGRAVLAALKDPLALGCALGEYMTEPKPVVWFDEALQPWDGKAAKAGRAGIELDSRSRMMYDAEHVFINGESHRARGADASLMRRLADQRSLSGRDLRRAGVAALALLGDWHEAGWLRQVAADPSGNNE